MVTDAVHAKRGYIYAQLWHCGRVALPHHTGMPTVSASADPWAANDPHPYPLPGTNELAMYKDFPPEKLDEEGISKIIDEMRNAARNAMTAGFDGIEIHGANGYCKCRSVVLLKSLPKPMRYPDAPIHSTGTISLFEHQHARRRVRRHARAAPKVRSGSPRGARARSRILKHRHPPLSLRSVPPDALDPPHRNMFPSLPRHHAARGHWTAELCPFHRAAMGAITLSPRQRCLSRQIRTRRRHVGSLSTDHGRHAVRFGGRVE